MLFGQVWILRWVLYYSTESNIWLAFRSFGIENRWLTFETFSLSIMAGIKRRGFSKADFLNTCHVFISWHTNLKGTCAILLIFKEDSEPLKGTTLSQLAAKIQAQPAYAHISCSEVCREGRHSYPTATQCSDLPALDGLLVSEQGPAGS